MAAFGVYGLVGWACASVGAMLLAALFRSLGRVMPHAPGGPYAYVRAAMGDRLGFVVAWGYWVSIWCTNAAIAVACVGYLSVFFPALASEPALGALTGLGLLWGVTAFNALPLRQVAALQGVTVVLKVVPLLLLILLGWGHIRWEWLMVAGHSGEGAFGAITAATTLALFAFLGVESASIASHRIRNPERNMGRASVMGTALTVVLYVGCSVVVMGTVSPEGLMDSPALFAESASTFRRCRPRCDGRRGGAGHVWRLERLDPHSGAVPGGGGSGRIVSRCVRPDQSVWCAARRHRAVEPAGLGGPVAQLLRLAGLHLHLHDDAVDVVDAGSFFALGRQPVSALRAVR